VVVMQWPAIGSARVVPAAVQVAPANVNGGH
jgi:hypothetical protein